ncbi:MAG TPA: cytochrome c, partial [Bryobacteraceae bacterium]|nr:cytochrome c [Bryobacteraceae bacterium]
MSTPGVSLWRFMILVGLTILLIPQVLAKKNPAISPSGREVYMNRCSACHGEDGKGNGPAVGALKVAPADLTLLAQRNAGAFPTERVKNIVGQWVEISAHGSREMPIWGEVFFARKPADQQLAAERFKSLV